MYAQASIARLINSLPLSTVIACGARRTLQHCGQRRGDFDAGERAIGEEGPAIRACRGRAPSACGTIDRRRGALTKSIDHRSFGRVGIGKGTRARLASFRRGLVPSALRVHINARFASRLRASPPDVGASLISDSRIARAPRPAGAAAAGAPPADRVSVRIATYSAARE